MGQLKLYGMRTAYDKIIGTALKHQHEPQQIIGDLLTAEICEKQARSIKYQMTIAKLPLAKELPSHGLLCKPRRPGAAALHEDYAAPGQLCTNGVNIGRR